MGGVLAASGFATRSLRAAISGAAKATHGLDWATIITGVAVAATIIGGIAAVIAVVPMLRNATLKAWQRTLRWLGVPYSRYANRFVKVYGSYSNPYLNRTERLDLRTTYVPLSFRSDGNEQQYLTPAADVLATLGSRTVIVGIPGSGKSTLLQAHGVSVLDSRASQKGSRTSRRVKVVPFLVRLRDLATFLEPDAPRTLGQNILADYLISEVLVKQEFFRSHEGAADFLRDALTKGSALVMLDGLDEVPDGVLSELLSAVDDFVNDGTETHPTRRARILLTCRTQNFEALHDGWIDSGLAPYDLFSLAPLGDRDIMAYLSKFGHQQWFPSLRSQPPLFRTEQGPQRFFDAISEDDKIDLLRVPLVLAMAVSLYAEAPELIPSTIGNLYQNMIEEMLDRHSFGTPSGQAVREAGTLGRHLARVSRHAVRRHSNAQSRYSLNEFQVVDKYSFLRQFALEEAKQAGTFGDFTRERLEKFASERTESLNMSAQPDAFVEEILTHSGLVTDAGRDDLWHFAHRSLQEFLAAQELRLDGDSEFLIEKSEFLEWRQTIQFYAAGQESRQIDEFLIDLATRNSELSVRCLRVCRPSLNTARQVLGYLIADSREAVTALAAATHCPMAAIRDLAIARLKEAIIDPNGVFGEAGFEIEEMLPLLDSLTRTNASGVAAVLPSVIDRLPDDPRLVRPLWQCLGAEGFEEYLDQGCQIASRLLHLAVDREAFAVLSGQGRRDPSFLTKYRDQAYPFKRGLDSGHNLVTLLAWADYLTALGGQVVPDQRVQEDNRALEPLINRFWSAREAGKLRTLEEDKRRTLSFSLCWPARIFSGLMLIGAIAAVFAELSIGANQSLDSLAEFPLMLALAFSYVPALVVVIYGSLFAGYRKHNYRPVDMDYRPLASSSHSGNGNVLLYITVKFPSQVMLIDLTTFTVPPISFGLLAFLLMHGSDEIGWILTSFQFIFWATCLNFFSASTRFYLRQPNVYVDAYEDPKSRHWLVQDTNRSTGWAGRPSFFGLFGSSQVALLWTDGWSKAPADRQVESRAR